MVDAAVPAGDEIALLFAPGIEMAVLHQVGVQIGQKLHASRVQLPDHALEIGVELFVRLPVPPDLIAHHGLVAAGPVLAPHAADRRALVQQAEGLPEHLLPAALGAKDHAVHAPVGDVLPVGRLDGNEGRKLLEAAAPLQDQGAGAGVVLEAVFLSSEIRPAVGVGIKADEPSLVGDKDRHRGIAADASVLFFPVQGLGDQGLFQDGGGLDVLGDKVFHPLAPEIGLTVLFAASENGLALQGRQGELVGPALLALQEDLHAPGSGLGAQGEPVPFRGENDGLPLPLHLGQGDPGGLLHLFPVGPALFRIGLFPLHGGSKGFFHAVKGQDHPVLLQGPGARAHLRLQHDAFLRFRLFSIIPFLSNSVYRKERFFLFSLPLSFL